MSFHVQIPQRLALLLNTPAPWRVSTVLDPRPLTSRIQIASMEAPWATQCDSMWFNPTSPTLATLLDLFYFVSKCLHPNLLLHLSLRGLYHSWSNSVRTIEMEWEAVLGAEKSCAKICFGMARHVFFHGAKGTPIKDILKGWQPALTRYESSQPMLRNESLAGVSQSFSMSVLVQRSNRLWHFSETRWDKIQKTWQNSWPIMTKLCHSHVLCWWLADDIW